MKNQNDPAKGYKELLSSDDGHLIDPQTAEKWRENYRIVQKTHHSGNKSVEGLVFKKEHIIKIFSNPDVIGIRIYYGITNEGDKELIIYPVDKLGNDLTAEPLARNDIGIIEKEIAKRWRKNYEYVENNKKSDRVIIKGHFFGKNGILPLVNLSQCFGIMIYYGLNNHGEKELLIYAVESNWKHIELEKPINPLDYSKKCPPYC